MDNELLYAKIAAMEGKRPLAQRSFDRAGRGLSERADERFDLRSSPDVWQVCGSKPLSYCFAILFPSMGCRGFAGSNPVAPTIFKTVTCVTVTKTKRSFGAVFATRSLLGNPQKSAILLIGPPRVVASLWQIACAIWLKQNCENSYANWRSSLVFRFSQSGITRSSSCKNRHHDCRSAYGRARA